LPLPAVLPGIRRIVVNGFRESVTHIKLQIVREAFGPN
jgi:hypothetical protein